MKPILQAILLAEHVYEDKSGKKIIAGTFHRIHLNRKGAVTEDVPSDSTKKIYRGGGQMGSPYVYISLTDLHPEVELNLQVSNVATSQVVLDSKFKIQCKDRLAIHELIYPLPPLTVFINQAGTYALDLLWNNEILGSHRIIAEDVTPG